MSTSKNKDYIFSDNTPISVDTNETKEVSIYIQDDLSIESLESFVVTLDGTYVGDGITSVLVTIEDDDCELIYVYHYKEKGKEKHSNIME